MVTIRLARFGRKKVPFYRIVAADKEMRRDGRYLEALGFLNPTTDPVTYKLNGERVKYWVECGAQITDSVVTIVNKEIPGYLDTVDNTRLDKLRSKRKARKSRSAGTKKIIPTSDKAVVSKAPKAKATKSDSAKPAS